jgi:NAD(P)-dependent dehydrogenase (short-subunit alcohol dehydrogenase family)
MDMGLEGKIAVVTGSATGLGRAIALALADEGCHVTVADIKEEQAKQVAREVNARGPNALAITTDVTRGVAVRAMVDRTLGEFGQIDILVANAGVVGPQGPWADLTEEGFDHVVAVNFKGVFLSAKAIIPHMIAQRSGKIIIISSCAAKTGEEFNGVYSATKAAVRNMTQSLAFELGEHNINVNAVCPAAMDTDLMEKVYRERSEFFGIDPDDLRKRIKGSFRMPGDLTVQDAANVVVFLASKKANKMTGQAINITSGIETH